MKKKRLAIYTGTGCKACEHAILDLHYQVNPLTRGADLCFWPYLLGSTWNELEKAERCDVAIYAGAIRTAADAEAAARLRDKADLLVALGACAAFGGLPGLINLVPPADRSESDQTPEAEGPALPEAREKVAAVPSLVPVDYIVPGCPPPQNFLWALLQCLLGRPGLLSRISFAAHRLPEALAQAATAGIPPRRGAVFAGERAVCASCSRIKQEKRFTTAKRPQFLELDEGLCLLEQGLVCAGVATREGCGGLCTGVGAPCRGCYGKAENIIDPGAKLVSAISSTFDAEKPDEVAKIVGDMVDLSGTFYRYTLASQCLLAAAPPVAAESDSPAAPEALAAGEEA